VKKADLDHQLRRLGWSLLRQGGRHEVWSDGLRQVTVPRHREINENTARAILRAASKED
jgi:mRNA interferase HicA